MKIGTIGTGAILHFILDSIIKIDNISCEAVYSRKEETAKVVADKYKIQKIYTNLDEMFQDKQIDFIYIASPNSLHYEHAKKALQYEKNVICEKPFTSTLKEAKELAEIAKQKKLFLYEAITTMYLPNFKLIQDKLSQIGRIKLVTNQYCQYSSRYDSLLEGKIANVFNPEFSGGALMDINFYNIYFTIALFGIPKKAKYYPNQYKNGIDTSGILVMQYDDFVCECTGAKDTWGVNFAEIMGERGYLYIPDGANGCKEVQVVTRNDKEVFNYQSDTPWFYEILEITKQVKEKNYQECYKRLDKTLEIVKFLEEVRKEANIRFKADILY